jgi:hypothetical protein
MRSKKSSRGSILRPNRALPVAERFPCLPTRLRPAPRGSRGIDECTLRAKHRLEPINQCGLVRGTRAARLRGGTSIRKEYSTCEGVRKAVAMSLPGTLLPIWNVRATVAIRGKAEVRFAFSLRALASQQSSIWYLMSRNCRSIMSATVGMPISGRLLTSSGSIDTITGAIRPADGIDQLVHNAHQLSQWATASEKPPPRHPGYRHEPIKPATVEIALPPSIGMVPRRRSECE